MIGYSCVYFRLLSGLALLAPTNITALDQSPTLHLLHLGVDSLQYALYTPPLHIAAKSLRPLVLYLHGGAGGTNVE